MTSYLRPDELSAASEIKKAKGRTNAVRSGLETVASLGTGVLASSAASKILPFLSQYVPEDLAYKGINKVMPHIGSFLKNGMSQGLSLKSGLDFLKNELSNQEIKTEPAKENRNIIEQYSPELFSFLTDEIKKGRTPTQAAGLALSGKKAKDFNKAIDKMVADHGIPFSQIIETVFGSGKTAQQQPKPPNMMQQLLQQEQGMQPQQQQQPQQGGPGQQALMDIMQKINQRLGG